MLLARSEHLILSVLSAQGPCYGLELVHASRGRLKRGSVYVTLGRMEEKGYVTSSARGDDGRRRYRPTALGARALVAARAFAGQIRLEAKT